MNSASIAATSGIPLAYIIGILCSWQLTALIGAFLPTIGIFIFTFVITKDSPVYFMNQGLQDQSLETLKWCSKQFSILLLSIFKDIDTIIYSKWLIKKMITICVLQ